MSPAETEHEKQFLARAVQKLPALDLFWPDDLQAAWWRCFEALAKMAGKPRPAEK